MADFCIKEDRPRPQWNKGEIVIFKMDGKTEALVLITNPDTRNEEGDGHYETFAGVDLVSSNYREDWVKPSFQAFNGELTLRNQ